MPTLISFRCVVILAALAFIPGRGLADATTERSAGPQMPSTQQAPEAEPAAEPEAEPEPAAEPEAEPEPAAEPVTEPQAAAQPQMSPQAEPGVQPQAAVQSEATSPAAFQAPAPPDPAAAHVIANSEGAAPAEGLGSSAPQLAAAPGHLNATQPQATATEPDYLPPAPGSIEATIPRERDPHDPDAPLWEAIAALGPPSDDELYGLMQRCASVVIAQLSAGPLADAGLPDRLAYQ